MDIRLIYKCRICGHIHEGEIREVSDNNPENDVLAYLSDNRQGMESFQKIAIHHCVTILSCYGICDLVAFRREDVALIHHENETPGVSHQ
jgi:hypothetical protein